MGLSNLAVSKFLELAAHSLLSYEASPILALEEFTVNLFPPLLTAAFAKGHKKALKALVQAWPFPFLRLGSLIVQWPNQDSLQTAGWAGGLPFPQSLSQVMRMLEPRQGHRGKCFLPRQGESQEEREGVLIPARARNGESLGF